MNWKRGLIALILIISVLFSIGQDKKPTKKQLSAREAVDRFAEKIDSTSLEKEKLLHKMDSVNKSR
jgi:hypothetical protein